MRNARWPRRAARRMWLYRSVFCRVLVVRAGSRRIGGICARAEDCLSTLPARPSPRLQRGKGRMAGGGSRKIAPAARCRQLQRVRNQPGQTQAKRSLAGAGTSKAASRDLLTRPYISLSACNRGVFTTANTPDIRKPHSRISGSAATNLPVCPALLLHQGGRILERRLLAAHQRDHDLAVTRGVRPPHQGEIAIEDPRLNHRVARDFERIVLTRPE